jgi:O-antigen/teichoic acid export membrane protein
MELQEDSIKEQDTQPQEPTLKEKTAKGLFWGGISNGVQQVLGVVFGIILARTLDPGDYGLVAMLAIFTGISNAIINSGFSTALTNKTNTTHKDYNAVFWFSFFTGLVLYIILYFCAPQIAVFYDRPELTKLSRVIFISFFFSGIAIVPYTIMFKKLMVKQQAQIDIAASIISGIIGIVLAIKNFGYWSLAIQSTTYMVLGFCLRYFISSWHPTLKIDFSPLKEMFSFSSKILLTTIFQQIHANFITVLLGKFYNAIQLGYYYQGNKWMGMVNQLVAGMINMIAQPVIVQVNDDKVRQLRIFRKLIRFSAFIVFPVFGGLAFISPEFIPITIGSKWDYSIIFLQLLCLWGAISPFTLLYAQLIIAHGKSNIYLWGIVAVGSLQVLILILLFILNISIIYLVASFSVTYCFSILYWNYWANQLINIKLVDFFKDIIPYLTTSIISIVLTGILLYKIENIYILLLGKILIVAIIYIAILWKLNSVVLKDFFSIITKLINNH